MDEKGLLVLPIAPPKNRPTISLSTGSSASSLVDLKVPQYGGSFSYGKDDIQLCSSLGRRYLLWRVTGECLDVDESSFDVDLVENSLRFQFKDDAIMYGVTMDSAGGRIYLLVPTFSVAQRICIPFFGGGSMIRDASNSFISFNSGRSLTSLSVLALLNANELSSRRHCYTLNIGSGSATPRTAATALSSSEEALFAYALSDGTIVLITMPAYDDEGPTTQDVFSQSSVVRRLITGFISPFSRGDTLSASTSTSLAFQVLPEDVLLLAAGFDHKVRAWSCKQRDLVCETMVSSSHSLPSSHYIGGDKERIKSSTDRGSPFSVVYSVVEGIGEFRVFYSTNQGRQWELVKVLEFEAPEADLLDISFSNQGLYTLWSHNGATLFQYKELSLTSANMLNHGRWYSETLRLEHRALEDDDFDDSQLVIDNAFNSRAFLLDVITKAIKLCGKNFTSSSSFSSLARLKRDFEEYVDTLGEEQQSTGGGSRSRSKSKFLRSFWSCCLQYDQECSKPVSLLHCPDLALYGVVLTKKVAFLVDVATTVSGILGKECSIPSPLQSSFVECFSKTRRVYAAVPRLDRTFDAAIFDQDKSPFTVLYDQMVEALYSQETDRVKRSLSAAEPALDAALKGILQYLDRSDYICKGGQANRRHTDHPMPFDSRLAFRSELGSTYLSSAVDMALRQRYELAKSTLLLIALCTHLKGKLRISTESWRFIEQDCIPRLSELLRFYATLKWAFSTTVEPSDSKAPKSRYVLDHLIEHPIGDKIRTYWQTYWNIFQITDTGSEVNAVVQATIDSFWPSNMFTVLFDYFIQTEQYGHLLELCDRMDSHCDQLTFCRVFVQGCGLLYLDCPREALVKFGLAYEGIERGDQVLLEHLALTDSDQTQVLYFIKVASMFENKGLSEYAIETCENAVRLTSLPGASLSAIFIMMFKHYLRLQNYDEAFGTILKMTTDRNTQRSCLRQFVFHLQEEKLLGKLNGYDFGDLENEVLDVVESRARVSDLLENYYDFLYAFFVSRGNYRKATVYSYEMAMRYRKELSGLEGLRRQVNALAVCVHTLALEEGAMVEVPVLSQEENAPENGRSSPKRYSDGSGKRNGTTTTWTNFGKEELEREYVLTKGNLALAEMKGAYVTLLPAKELVKGLLQYNLFDMAVSVATAHELSLVDIVECLALRCVQADKPRIVTGFSSEDWLRLSENNAIASMTSTSSGSNFVWLLLHGYLDQLSKVVPSSPLYAAAMRRFLSLSQTIPVWFIDEFKKIDFPELLRSLLEYDRLMEAHKLLCNYIDAVLGVGAEDFNLQETLKTGKLSPVWLPFSSIDLLLSILAEKQEDSNAAKMRNELEEKLKHYFHQLDARMRYMRAN